MDKLEIRVNRINGALMRLYTDCGEAKSMCEKIGHAHQMAMETLVAAQRLEDDICAVQETMHADRKAWTELEEQRVIAHRIYSEASNEWESIDRVKHIAERKQHE